MKRGLILFLLILCCCGLTVSALSIGSAESIEYQGVVSEDSSCTVNITATITYDSDHTKPDFPVPMGAEDVVLNGSPADLTNSANFRRVSLSGVTGGKAGTYTITIRYRLPAVVTSTKEDGMQLDLQVLSGFPLPVDQFDATVTLPGKVDATPRLISGYYQQDTAELLEVSVSGDTITLHSLRPLKDNETLSMALAVDGSMFPKTERTARVLGVMDLAIALSAVLAIVYYLLTMRPQRIKTRARADAPDGVTAGETGLWYTGAAVDLTMLVVTWAQLGYVRIQVEEGGRILLHKRMDMGNERSAYENRCYQELFGKRRIVDGTSFRYAELCYRLAHHTPRLKDFYMSNSGNPYLYRGLCALRGLLSGIAMAGAFAAYSVPLQVLLAGVLGIFSLLLQRMGRSLPLRKTAPIRTGLTCGLIWVILGILSGEWLMALIQIVLQTLAGLALAYGGRRTELGQQAMTQIAGLRRHMRTVSKTELQRLLKLNPNYFYDLAPYALALGLDKTFARRFGRLRMPECTYLIKGTNGQMTATEWAAMLRHTVNKLNARSKRVLWEKLTGR